MSFSDSLIFLSSLVEWAQQKPEERSDCFVDEIERVTATNVFISVLPAAGLMDESATLFADYRLLAHAEEVITNMTVRCWRLP
jgi:hypothetical protein